MPELLRNELPFKQIQYLLPCLSKDLAYYGEHRLGIRGVPQLAECLGKDDSPFGQHHGAFHQILQLSNVPREGIALQQ